MLPTGATDVLAILTEHAAAAKAQAMWDFFTLILLINQRPVLLELENLGAEEI